MKLTEKLNAKSKDYIETHERNFASAVERMFSLEGRANTTLARDAARAIVTEKLKNGSVSRERAREIFEYVYGQAILFCKHCIDY